MRVLLHAYNTCCQTESGGVQVRIRKIKSLLEAAGLEVDFFSPYETRVKDYDVLHVFGLHAETERLISCAKTLGLKVVLSSIVNITPMRAMSIRNTLVMKKFLNVLGVYTLESSMYSAINNCDIIIAETNAEARFIHKYYKIPCHRIKVLPNGIDDIAPTSMNITEITGFSGKYVLQVGRIDENKNLLNTIKAITGTDIKLIVVGGPFAASKSKYYEVCRKTAERNTNILFLGWLKSGSEELNTVYQNAHVLVVPSYQETFGLVSVEGAMAGAHVCMSNTLPILEYGVFDYRLTFNPNSPKEIRHALELALSLPKDLAVKNKAKDCFSWDKIIKEHIKIYNE